MSQDVTGITVLLAVQADGDLAETAEAASRLRRELLDLDVDAVGTPVTGPPPPGSKGLGGAAVGSLLVSLTDPQTLGAIVQTVRAWLSGGSAGRSVKLELGGDVLELTGVSSSEQRRLADEWLARHPVGR